MRFALKPRNIGHGFNRYMVECELPILYLKSERQACFNRYMVECELNLQRASITVQHGFNRYMVECEFTVECESYHNVIAF